MILELCGPELWGVTFAGNEPETLFLFKSLEKAEAFIAEWPGRRARLFKVRVDLEERARCER